LETVGTDSQELASAVIDHVVDVATLGKKVLGQLLLPGGDVTDVTDPKDASGAGGNTRQREAVRVLELFQSTIDQVPK